MGLLTSDTALNSGTTSGYRLPLGCFPAAARKRAAASLKTSETSDFLANGVIKTPCRSATALMMAATRLHSNFGYSASKAEWNFQTESESW